MRSHRRVYSFSSWPQEGCNLPRASQWRARNRKDSLQRRSGRDLSLSFSREETARAKAGARLARPGSDEAATEAASRQTTNACRTVLLNQAVLRLRSNPDWSAHCPNRAVATRRSIPVDRSGRRSRADWSLAMSVACRPKPYYCQRPFPCPEQRPSQIPMIVQRPLRPPRWLFAKAPPFCCRLDSDRQTMGVP